MPGHREFDFGAGLGAAPNVEPRANSLCTLTHAKESKMSVAPRTQNLLVETAAIVAYHNTQPLARISKFDLDVADAGMAKCVEQGFTADAIDLIAGDRVQGPLPAVYDHPKGNRRFEAEFRLNQGKGLFQIERRAGLTVGHTAFDPLELGGAAFARGRKACERDGRLDLGVGGGAAREERTDQYKKGSARSHYWRLYGGEGGGTTEMPDARTKYRWQVGRL